MTERIKKAIDLFLDAINNGTLAKGSCTACAVGNLVAHGMNGTITGKGCSFNSDVDNDMWGYLFMTGVGSQTIHTSQLKNPKVISNIEATDFTWRELAQIEYVFEMNTKINSNCYPNYNREQIKQDQINGLEAVIEVMMGFDDVKEDIKEVFTNKVTV